MQRTTTPKAGPTGRPYPPIAAGYRRSLAAAGSRRVRCQPVRLKVKAGGRHAVPGRSRCAKGPFRAGGVNSRAQRCAPPAPRATGVDEGRGLPLPRLPLPREDGVRGGGREARSAGPGRRLPPEVGQQRHLVRRPLALPRPPPGLQAQVEDHRQLQARTQVPRLVGPFRQRHPRIRRQQAAAAQRRQTIAQLGVEAARRRRQGSTSD